MMTAAALSGQIVFEVEEMKAEVNCSKRCEVHVLSSIYLQAWIDGTRSEV